MHVIPEGLEPEEKSAPSPSERLASLNAKTAERADDGRLFSVPPEYAGLTYAEYATSSRLSKITVGNGSAEDVKTILEALVRWMMHCLMQSSRPSTIVHCGNILKLAVSDGQQRYA